MNKSLMTLCFVFSLFYLTSANLIMTYQQITEKLGNLTETFDREINCNSTFVPKLGETQNVSVAEISCRAKKSLEKVCPSERKHLQALKHCLVIVYKQAKKPNQVINCDVSEEQEDIVSFLHSLRSYFRYNIFNYKQ